MQVKKNIKKITISALFAAFAVIVGIAESMLNLNIPIFLPGVKLGIANIFIILAYKLLGAKYAFCISITRVLMVYLFTGNTIGLVLSLLGAIFSFLALIISMKYYNKCFTFISISSISALLHATGQIIAAYIFVGFGVTYYLPVLLFACMFTGIFTGILINISIRYMEKIH